MIDNLTAFGEAAVSAIAILAIFPITIFVVIFLLDRINNFLSAKSEKCQTKGKNQTQRRFMQIEDISGMTDSARLRFMHIVRLDNKKPVFLPEELRDRLYILVLKSGNRGLAPSHIVTNLVKWFLDEYQETNSKKESK